MFWATPRDAFAKKNGETVRPRQFFAETSRDVAPAIVLPKILKSFIYYSCFIAISLFLVTEIGTK
jgi:hypothetical protein